MHRLNKFSSKMREQDKQQFRAVSIPKRVDTQGKLVHGMPVVKRDELKPSREK